MLFSEKNAEAFTAFIKAQSEVKTALKDSKNPFYKTKYADLNSVWDACRDAIHGNGFAVTQLGGFEGTQPILITLLIHSSGQWIRSDLPLICEKPTPQAYGSAITYMRRYGLESIMGICRDDDDGEAAVNQEERKKAEEAKKNPPTPPADIPRITPPEAQMLRMAIDKLPPEHQKGMNKWLTTKGYMQLTDIPTADYSLIITRANQILSKSQEDIPF